MDSSHVLEKLTSIMFSFETRKYWTKSNSVFFTIIWTGKAYPKQTSEEEVVFWKTN